MDNKDSDYKNVIKILNFLKKCFPPDPGDYKYLEKHAWVMAVYTMVKELTIAYSLNGQEENIRNFIKDFHGKVYIEDFRNSNINYQRFYDNVRGGWSEKIISLRKNILLKEFLDKYQLAKLDERRQISDEEKIAIFSKSQSCEICNKKLKDYRSAQYHHKKQYIDGGQTTKDNIMVVCQDCHKKIHGKFEISAPNEAEIEEDEE
jgi:5-methylcytosine-specific restriction endonuclease McrA